MEKGRSDYLCTVLLHQLQIRETSRITRQMVGASGLFHVFWASNLRPRHAAKTIIGILGWLLVPDYLLDFAETQCSLLYWHNDTIMRAAG